MMNRRGLLRSFVVLAAPAIIRTPGLLMPVHRLELDELFTPQMITREVVAIYRETAAALGADLRLRDPVSFRMMAA